MTSNALRMISTYGFWVDRETWKDIADDHERFYHAREQVLLALEKMVQDLTTFVSDTDQLQSKQVTGSGHEPQASDVSQEWMAKYKVLQNTHVQLLPVLTAILTPVHQYHVHVPHVRA